MLFVVCCFEFPAYAKASAGRRVPVFSSFRRKERTASFFHYSLFAIHCSLPAYTKARRARFTIYYSLFAIHYLLFFSLFTIHYSLFTIPLTPSPPSSQ